MRDAILEPGTRRLQLNLTRCGIPEVPLLGASDLVRAQPGLSRHVHAGLMEICYLVRGERTYHVAGRDYTFRGNQVFLTLPDEPHGSGRHMHGKGLLYWMQVRLPEPTEPFLGLIPAQARVLADRLRAPPRRRFHGRRRMRTLLENAMRIARDSVLPLDGLRIRVTLLEFLLLVAEAARDEKADLASPDIQRAMHLVRRAPEARITVENLAAASGLSLSRFKSKFREQVGMPPGEFILREKVGRARQLLSDGHKSVTEIAYELGFSSSQYFATVFKRFEGITPSEAAAIRPDAKPRA